MTSDAANMFAGALWAVTPVHPGMDHGHGRDESGITHDHEDAAAVTDRVHENSWSANLEHPRHAGDRDLTVAEAVAAVEHTAPGYHVNLVTHGDNGHPESYLFEALAEAFGDEATWEYVDQCGCGGHVTRVRVGRGAGTTG